VFLDMLSELLRRIEDLGLTTDRRRKPSRATQRYSGPNEGNND